MRRRAHQPMEARARHTASARCAGTPAAGTSSAPCTLPVRAAPRSSRWRRCGWCASAAPANRCAGSTAGARASPAAGGRRRSARWCRAGSSGPAATAPSTRHRRVNSASHSSNRASSSSRASWTRNCSQAATSTPAVPPRLAVVQQLIRPPPRACARLRLAGHEAEPGVEHVADVDLAGRVLAAPAAVLVRPVAVEAAADLQPFGPALPSPMPMRL